MLYAFANKTPKIIGENHFIAASADVIGAVIIHNNVSILPQAVVRADNDVIEIAENTNIQDGAVLHTDPGIPMIISKNVTVAHNAMLHGCSIGENSVIGIGAVVLNKAEIGKNCMIAANSLILENQKIPDGSLVMGSPGRIKGQLTAKQITQMQVFAAHYVEKISLFNGTLKVIEFNE